MIQSKTHERETNLRTDGFAKRWRILLCFARACILIVYNFRNATVVLRNFKELSLRNVELVLTKLYSAVGSLTEMCTSGSRVEALKIKTTTFLIVFDMFVVFKLT